MKAGDTTNSGFFLIEGVVKSCRPPIEERFRTLIEANCERPFDWYKDLGLDKANASRIRRGITIPPEWFRIKIANYFKVDSATIWKAPEIISADELNKQQEEKKC